MVNGKIVVQSGKLLEPMDIVEPIPSVVRRRLMSILAGDRREIASACGGGRGRVRRLRELSMWHPVDSPPQKPFYLLPSTQASTQPEPEPEPEPSTLPSPEL